jgi:hypothetical protein
MATDHPQYMYCALNYLMAGQGTFPLIPQPVEKKPFSAPYISHSLSSPLPTSIGKWTQEEQYSYVEFLCDHLDHFRSKVTRKTQKVFLQMSHTIQSRTSEQCRTHHQKMLKFHGCMEHIIRALRRPTTDLSTTEEKRNTDSMRNEEWEGLVPDGPYYMRMSENNTLTLFIHSESILSF